MYAVINLPGSKYFAYFKGDKDTCDAWLKQQEREYQGKYGASWVSAYFPVQIITDEKAKTWNRMAGREIFGD